MRLQGVVFGHAYSLLRVEEESDASGTYRLVQLRYVGWGPTKSPLPLFPLHMHTAASMSDAETRGAARSGAATGATR